MIQLMQSKKKDNKKLVLKNAYKRGSSLETSFQENKQPVVKKFSKPRGLGKYNLNVEIEVSEPASANGNHSNYIERLIRHLTEQNKHIAGLSVTVWKKSVIKML